MFHEPPRQFLYSSYKINTEFSHLEKIIPGVATGFLLQICKTAWIVTNRHVIDLDYRKPTSKYKNYRLSKMVITGRRPDDSEYSMELSNNSEFYYHEDYENDVALIKAKVSSNQERTFHWHFGMDHLADKSVFKDVQVFDLICFSGFPDTHDKFGNRPIVRSGRIASDPNYSYSWNKEYKGQCIAFEGFSSEGASGSPIFAPPRGMRGQSNSRNGFLIGVNAGHVPDTHGHSGISYFYKSTVIIDIISKNGLDSQISE